jgi:FAD-dependent urate hydroxylase
MFGLKVVVVGAGIGGLCAGLALRRAGFEVEIYERAPEIRPVGFGLCMWPNGAKAMNALGLATEMDSISPQMNAVEFRTKDGELLSHIALEPLRVSTGQRPYPVARADLHLTLLERYGRESVQLGAECVDVRLDGEKAIIELADGRTVSGDLVIGADGLRSTVRRKVFGDFPVRRLSADWEGLVGAVSGFTPSDTFTFYVGDGKRAAMMPVARGQFYFFFDFPLRPDGEQAGNMREELRSLFAGWCQPVLDLIEAVDPSRAASLEHRDLEPIDQFAYERVALLGDAAHATSPFLGQGAAMAAEDAIVLAHFLQTTSIGVPDALGRYQRERSDRVWEVVRGSREKGEAAVAADVDANERYYQELRHGSRDFVDAVERITVTGPLR